MMMQQSAPTANQLQINPVAIPVQPAPTADQLQLNSAAIPMKPSSQHQLQTNISLTQKLFLHDQATVFAASSPWATHCSD